MNPRTSKAPLPRSVSSSNSCIEVLAPSAMIGSGNNLKVKKKQLLRVLIFIFYSNNAPTPISWAETRSKRRHLLTGDKNNKRNERANYVPIVWQWGKLDNSWTMKQTKRQRATIFVFTEDAHCICNVDFGARMVKKERNNSDIKFIICVIRSSFPKSVEVWFQLNAQFRDL